MSSPERERRKGVRAALVPMVVPFYFHLVFLGMHDKEQQGKEVDGETYIHRLVSLWCARNVPCCRESQARRRDGGTTSHITPTHVDVGRPRFSLGP
jgi:hypothetical protein